MIGESTTPARPVLLGHRGARRYAPENTVEAFELALAHGCDGFEFDVRLTSDQRLIICHDARLSGREVASSQYHQFQPAPPCLKDVLERFAARAVLDIELKVSGPEAEIVAMIRERPPQRGFVVSSFLPQALQRIHAADNSIPLGLICDTPEQLAGWTSLPIEAVFLERGLVTPGIVEALHQAGNKVLVWTVNREREMRQFAEMGIDGIISDDTRLLANTLASQTMPR